MSERYKFILTYAEKVIGILLALIGIALTYNTYTNQTAVRWGFGYFIALGIFLILIGSIMLIIKAK